ncbi:MULTISPECIES: efflux transporter outer membrane subunit [Nitrospirillum]|uniref:NodT family efflux transporter outer membrane factor (OMF) lipoprotein n=1 Tax=Nitrospirillum amazonense TaxID=28077 RepID=A0A560FC92_9PROT|nr:efflux transporter outer membrane subunit [Nitrospirillum amazonense]MEC4589969.1 efflux transporter outer membrane subunit [Nitrospirillum amazonense]TWB19223.1 NodT family efflux transporter outer membrane factor (OMF) lipoprotein [Nitrospirillum amazonense]
MASLASLPDGRLPRAAVAAALSLVLLPACTVGPDYTPPAPPVSTHYDREAESRLASGGDRPGDQRTKLGEALDGDWWTVFRSPRLNLTMRGAIDGNFDLKIADARIAQASEAVRAAGGDLYPQVDLGAQIGRGRSNAPTPATANFYAVGPRVSFDLDIFGGTKRLVEQQGALADAQKHRFEAAYLTLTGDVASQAFLLASARAQIAAVRTLLADDERMLALLRGAHMQGGVAQPDVALAETQLAQDQTLLPPLAQQGGATRHALAVLAGQGPAEGGVPDFDLDDFSLPPDLPLSLPSEMAHDRPDLLEAEAALRAASAAVGVATADLYPHLTLSGSLTQAGADPASVFQAGNSLWGVAAGLASPLFHGGALEANRRAAVDGYIAARATYQRTVVRSLGQVADVLQALDHDGDEYSAQERALAAAATSLRLNRDGYRAGETGVLQVLDAERAHQRALLGQIRAKTARYLDTVQFFIALGGNASGSYGRVASASKEP